MSLNTTRNPRNTSVSARSSTRNNTNRFLKMRNLKNDNVKDTKYVYLK